MRRLFCSKKQISATGHTTLPEAAQFPVDARAKHVPNKKALAVSRKGLKSEPPAKRVVCSGPVRACYRLRLKTLAFTLFKPSALAALATP